MTTRHKNLDTTNHHKVGYVQASDPGAVGAGIAWVDTSGAWPVVKVRNSGDTGWDVPGAGYAFRAHKNGSSQTIANNASTQVTWVTEEFDAGSWFDLANSEAVIPADGLYRFRFVMEFTSAGTGGVFLPQIAVDDSVVRQGPGTKCVNTEAHGAHIDAILSLSAGDTVQAYVYHFTSASRDIDGAAIKTWFEGVKL